jgi:hypothetical protein
VASGDGLAMKTYLTGGSPPHHRTELRSAFEQIVSPDRCPSHRWNVTVIGCRAGPDRKTSERAGFGSCFRLGRESFHVGKP